MKRKNLELLKENGFNVPDFVVVKWENRTKKIDTTNYNGKYAIRSSSYSEDGEENSFAGQFATYLNVSPKDINKKVEECFNSLNNQNIKDYIKGKNILDINLKMDVIIQKMVNSKYSGILFTSNPQGLINESVIVVGKGLGNKIVEDKVDTTTYYYNNTDSIYYYEGKKDILNEEQIKELIEISKRIKELLGTYIDIEFAIEKNKIYILQARPITTIDDSKLVFLDNSNIIESYPGISLPLTISFVNFVYSGVFKGEAYRLSKNKKLVESVNDKFNNMVGSCNGRLYYKISNWYTLIQFLPFSKKIIPIWQDMLGVKNKTYNKEKLDISIFTRLKIYFNTFKELRRVTKNMSRLNTKFIEINTYFDEHFNNNLTTEEILSLYNVIKTELLSIWDITLVNDLYSFIWTGILKNRLKKNKNEAEINNYISGITNIESLKPIKTLIDISYNKDNMRRKEYKEAINNYIKLYGDRNIEELKLESETFRSNPKLLEKKIKEYRKDKEKLKSIYQELNEDRNQLPSKGILTKYIAKKATTGIKNREISRLNRSRIYGMVRSMFTLIGKNLVKEKRIHKIEDIFYLNIEEIFNYQDYNLKEIIKHREEEYKIFKELPNYSRLIFSKKEFDKHHKNVNSVTIEIKSETLQGIPSSSGISEGYAVIIEDITKNYDIKDKIIITKMTDPGWVFLLASSIGIVSEKGSLLSHTAIISRELKIPSIVGVENATSIIKTGDYIRIDANTGIIKIIKRSKK